MKSLLAARCAPVVTATDAARRDSDGRADGQRRRVPSPALVDSCRLVALHVMCLLSISHPICASRGHQEARRRQRQPDHMAQVGDGDPAERQYDGRA